MASDYWFRLASHRPSTALLTAWLFGFRWRLSSQV
jgi:hypothetical protein